MENSYLILISSAFFLLGYLAIIFDKIVGIEKTAISLLTGVGLWLLYFAVSSDSSGVKLIHLNEHLANLSQIILFLIAAMLIVEVIEAHEGLSFLGKYLCSFKSARGTVCALVISSFFLSALLDNLTTMIVFVTLLKKFVLDKQQRIFLLSAVVISANIGGVWTPIGDVTTTMLWIGGRLTTGGVMQSLFLPCLISAFVLLIILFIKIPKEMSISQQNIEEKKVVGKKLVLIVGLGTFFLAPLLKMLLDLPPFMGILIGLAILWFITDLMHQKIDSQQHLRVMHALKKIDLSSVLFFLGILLAIDSLEVLGILRIAVDKIESLTNMKEMIACTIGLISSVLDNVPLVAACMRMYGLEIFPIDSYFWKLIAYSTGTGGSIFLIGSAPGIALMSLENVSFGWYFKKMSWISLITYFAGLFTLILIQ